ncbi:hypothetical protein D0863_07098 [Hortaea werneckii]|uniref:Uncharacterized protein n=1 Tax=Hortaea werneckii TaxID=91943 RepID=A0A3M7DVS1_HORWE|nr:hypothetical protein D0863_07098 [Hortaea werneckii]
MSSSQHQDLNNMTKPISSPTKPTQPPTPPPETSPLLTLPPELRNKIYLLALTSSTKRVPTLTGRLQRPALLKPNIQLRAETTQMWSASTTFQLPLNPSNLSNLHAFLSNVGRANLGVLGGLELQYDHCVVQAGGCYTHPSTRQEGVLALLVVLAEAGVRMDAVEVSTAGCKCREGGRCRSSARAWVCGFRMLLGGFRSTLEGGRGFW